MALSAHRLLDEQFANDDAVATPIAFRLYSDGTQTKHVIEWSEGVQAGEVTIEEAHREDYTGSWALVQTVTYDGSVTAAPKVEAVNHSGNNRAYRHRITAQVEGGTVTTRIYASE